MQFFVEIGATVNIDYRCDNGTKVGKLRGDIDEIR
jgi:hypothetical protein